MLLADTLELFAAPFSAFKQLDENTDIYQFKDRNILVKMDVVNGELSVISHKLNLAAIDNSNGVAFEWYVGDNVATETITMEDSPGRKLTY